MPLAAVADNVREVLPMATIEVGPGGDPMYDWQEEFDIAAARRDLGYEPPVTLGQGIRHLPKPSHRFEPVPEIHAAFPCLSHLRRILDISTMIYEITELPIRTGQLNNFMKAWLAAKEILACQPGYLGHEIGPQVEHPETVILIIKWRSLEAHTDQFAKSSDFTAFVSSFSEFVDGPVRVVHFSLSV